MRLSKIILSYLLLKRYTIKLIKGGSSIAIKSKNITLFVDRKGYIKLFSLHSFTHSSVK